MLFIELEELRKKGNILLLGNGIILDGVNDELLKVLDNIDDKSTDPEKTRKIKVELTIKPNFNRNSIILACDVSSTLAAKNVLQMRMNLEKSIDDEGKLITMKEDLGDTAEGQQKIDGSEEKAESFEIRDPEKDNVVEADFIEKASNSSMENENDFSEEIVSEKENEADTGLYETNNPFSDISAGDDWML